MVLMISQPMGGKTIKQIREEREDVRHALTLDGNVVIDSVIEDEPPPGANAGLWYLGKSLQMMAKVDGVAFMPGWKDARGCIIEHNAAAKYGLRIIEL